MLTTGHHENRGIADTVALPRSVARRHPDLTIRAARPRDCAALAAIYNYGIRSGRANMDTEFKDAGYFEALLDALGSREALVVGEAGGAVVAMGQIKRYSARRGYDHACESAVYVAEGSQGCGFGRRVTAALIERATTLGYRHVTAKILAVNEASIHLHRRLGFETVGVQRQIGCLDGVWHDIVILQRLLASEHHSTSFSS